MTASYGLIGAHEVIKPIIDTIDAIARNLCVFMRHLLELQFTGLIHRQIHRWIIDPLGIDYQFSPNFVNFLMFKVSQRVRGEEQEQKAAAVDKR